MNTRFPRATLCNALENGRAIKGESEKGISILAKDTLARLRSKQPHVFVRTVFMNGLQALGRSTSFSFMNLQSSKGIAETGISCAIPRKTVPIEIGENRVFLFLTYSAW